MIFRISVILLIAASSCLLAFAASPAQADEPQAEVPSSGKEQPSLASFDQWMKAFLLENEVPGGSLAISKDGRLVYARGFGYAEKETKSVVQPDSLFRIASISKPITAVAIMQLVEQDKLSLDEKIVDILKLKPHLEEGAKLDSRWEQITVEHCLLHTGGWDRGKSYDPMFANQRMAKSFGIELPINTEHIIRYMLGQPLETDPGAHYAYSNFGYCLLGRAIEKRSGQPYEAYVKKQVFAPLGSNAPLIGRSLSDQRAEKEVRYYEISGAEETAVVGPEAGKKKVPISYGAWNQENLDSHGGWITSASDLVRFGAALDQPGQLLNSGSLEKIFLPGSTINPGDKNGKGKRYLLNR